MPENTGEPPEHRNTDETRSAEAIRARLAQYLDDPAGTPLEVPSIPDHHLLHRIGSGAYGDVWLARSALGTARAVKIVYRARFKDGRPYEREFEGILKYEPISRTHEGLVHILHVGRNDATRCFYYVMELADDCNAELNPPTEQKLASPESSRAASPQHLDLYRPRTLRTELAQQERLRPVAAASLTLRLAKALGHLHQNGLVHRDIKPSNVIFVGGQPKLADIGLVTDVGSSHSFVGTEGFIPPEGPGTPQADLYGLGKLLYELATGRDRMEFPQLPPRVSHQPDGEALLELNEVITRACAPELDERYATVMELRADLNLFLAGRSLRRARNFEKYLARLKKFAAAASVTLVLLIVALWLSKREERHAYEMARVANERALAEFASRSKERTLRLRAEAAEDQTQQQLYTALLEQARATVRSGDLGQRVRALDAVGRAATISNRVELRREAMAALALPDLRFQRALPLATPDLTMSWLDPRFERIALCRGRGPVEIRTVPDNQLLATLPATTNLMAYSATWSADGRFLVVKRDYASGGYHADLEVWEIQGPRLALLIRDVRYNSRSFHPYKPQLLVASANGLITLWDVETGKELSRRIFDATPENLEYSPDGNQVAASYRLREGWGVSVHQAVDGALVASKVFTSLPASIKWHPDGRRIVVTDYGGMVQLMDAHTGNLQTLGRHKAEAVSATFTPSGDYLLTGGWERELICWDVRTLQRAFTIPLDGYIAQIRADGQQCSIVTLNAIELYSFESPTAHRELASEMGSRLWHAVFSPDGRWLGASGDRGMGVWDLAAKSPGTFATEGSRAHLFWSADGQELFGSGDGVSCFRWQVQTATNLAASPTLQQLELVRPPGFISLSVSSNLLAWTTAQGSQVAQLENGSAVDEHWTETIPGINRISPDRRWLAMYRAYGTVLHVYDLPGLEPAARLTNQGSIAGFNYSPHRDEIAVASRGRVEFWSTGTWQRTRVATNYIGLPFVGMLFQPDGRSIWLLRDYRSAGLYDAQTFEPILLLPNGMIPLALDPGGRYLAVSLDAQHLQVWDMDEVHKQFRELGLDWEVPVTAVRQEL